MSLVCGLLMAGAGMLMGGCEDELSPNWVFENNSSYRVYVVPNGQSWPAATIGPGSSVEVDYNGDSIQYVYTPSEKVVPQRDKGRTIHFYNR
jgi:hypothetical protein